MTEEETLKFFKTIRNRFIVYLCAKRKHIPTPVYSFAENNKRIIIHYCYPCKVIHGIEVVEYV
jgi:hypothetical protein